MSIKMTGYELDIDIIGKDGGEEWGLSIRGQAGRICWAQWGLCHLLLFVIMTKKGGMACTCDMMWLGCALLLLMGALCTFTFLIHACVYLYDAAMIHSSTRAGTKLQGQQE
jgi:hypothetical protein